MKNTYKLNRWQRFLLPRIVRRFLRRLGFVVVRRSTLANWQAMTATPNGLGYRHALSDVIGQWPEQNAANTIPPNSEPSGR